MLFAPVVTVPMMAVAGMPVGLQVMGRPGDDANSFFVTLYAGDVLYVPRGAPHVLEDLPDPALNGPVVDATDLVNRLAASDHVKRCFVRQTFRAFMGRNERLADACTLAAMEAAYDGHDGSFVAMLEALVTSGTFRYRSVEEDQE